MKKSFRNSLILSVAFSVMAVFGIVLSLQSGFPLPVKLVLALGFLALIGYVWYNFIQTLRKSDAEVLKARVSALLRKISAGSDAHAVASVHRAPAAKPHRPAPRAEPALEYTPSAGRAARPAPAADKPAPPPPDEPLPEPEAPAAPETPLGVDILPGATALSVDAAPHLSVPLPDFDAPSLDEVLSAPPAPDLHEPVSELAPAPEKSELEESLEQIFARIKPISELDNPPDTTMTEEERRAAFERLKAADLERQRRRAAARAAAAAGALHPTGSDNATPVASLGEADRRALQRRVLENARKAHEEQAAPKPAIVPAPAGSQAAPPEPAAAKPPAPAPAKAPAKTPAKKAAKKPAPKVAQPVTAAPAPATQAPLWEPAAQTPAAPSRPLPAEPSAPLSAPDFAPLTAESALPAEPVETPAPSHPNPALDFAARAGVSLDTPLDELPPPPDEENETEAEELARNRVVVEARSTAQQILKDRAIHRALDEARQREERRKTIEQSQTVQANRRKPIDPPAPPQ